MCMVLNVEIYGFINEDFTPNRKNSSCQEMGGQYLRWCVIKNLCEIRP